MDDLRLLSTALTPAKLCHPVNKKEVVSEFGREVISLLLFLSLPLSFPLVAGLLAIEFCLIVPKSHQDTSYYILRLRKVHLAFDHNFLPHASFLICTVLAQLCVQLIE